MPRPLLILALAASLATTSRPAWGERPHTVYAELFGKGGLWGLGYDYRYGRYGVGGAVSAYVLDAQRVLSLSPYVTFSIAEHGRHGWFVQAGPQLVRLETPSPVPEWDGTSSTGIGAQLSSGWEYRGERWLVRSYLMAAVGQGGVAPWLGVDLGWRL